MKLPEAFYASSSSVSIHHTVLEYFHFPLVRQFVDVVDRKSPVPGWITFYVTNPPVGVISGCDHNDLIFEKGQLFGTDGSAVH